MPETYVFVSIINEEDAKKYYEDAKMIFREEEGVTLIISKHKIR